MTVAVVAMTIAVVRARCGTRLAVVDRRTIIARHVAAAISVPAVSPSRSPLTAVALAVASRPDRHGRVGRGCRIDRIVTNGLRARCRPAVATRTGGGHRNRRLR